MRSILITLLTAISLFSSGQYYYQDGESNPIYTAAEYFRFAPDARSVGAGESGAASTPDLFSMYWNPAKYAFLEDRFGIAVSFSDYYWMKEMYYFNEMEWNIGFNSLNGFWKITDRSVIASSFTYYNAFGEVYFTDEFGNALGTYNPYDLNVDLAYSHRISDVFSVAVAARYLRSKYLPSGQYIQGALAKTGNSFACDLAVYYQKPLTLGSGEGELRLGAGISNIGNKMSFLEDVDQKRFIPTNLRLGAGFTYRFNDDHSLSCQLDANKLLVPTPPEYLRDSLGQPVYDDEGNPVIAEGMDPDVSVPKGMIQSWYDAPGGFEEEWHEWSFGAGFEYCYKTVFSARSGIFYEHKTKGIRRYYTAGAGFKAGVFGMDLGLKVPIDRAIKDDYFSIFYLRTSVAISFP